MRLDGAKRVGTAGAAASASARGAAGGFSLGGAGAAQGVAATAAPSRVIGLDSLVMLQGVDEASERKRARQLGGRILDALDDLKIAMLSGGLDPAQIARLRDAATDCGDAYADGEIAEIMRAIDLRAQVELAKIERR